MKKRLFLPCNTSTSASLSMSPPPPPPSRSSAAALLAAVAATVFSLLAFFLPVCSTSDITDADASRYCPQTNCSNLPNVHFPFGTTDGCGLPEFRLVCYEDQALWWPRSSASPLYSVENITSNLNSTGTFVVQNASLNSCTALTASIPQMPPGLQLSPHGNVDLLLECSPPLLLSLEPNQSRLGFSFATPHCTEFYAACLGDFPVGSTAVPCFEQLNDDANLTIIKEQYQCESYAAVYEVPTSTYSPLQTQLSWNISSYYYSCVLCMSSNGTCGHNASDDNSFLCFCPKDLSSKTDCHVFDPTSTATSTATPTPTPVCTGLCRSSVQISLGGSAIAIAILIVGASFGVYCCWKSNISRRHLKDITSHDSSRELKQILADQVGPFPTKTFTYEELLHATKSFSPNKILGDGGFGTVYEGRLYDGQKVAVKRLYPDNTRRLEQFLNEIKIVSALSHPNLVKLFGFCCEKHDDLLLVYECVCNGTLADHLHCDKGKGLLWETRLNIALETAQSLAYLHSYDPPIFHRDVKSTNILLDENFHVKLADFGLSRLVPIKTSHVSTAPQGTPGYVDPDYHQCYQLTDKSDVYSFGVVLMEIISAKLPVDMSREKREINLSNLAVAKIQTGALDELIDPYLELPRYPVVRQMVTRVAELAFRCLAPEKDDRPCMKEVAEELHQITEFGYGDGNRRRKFETMVSLNSFDADETTELIKPKMPISPTSVQEKWPSPSNSTNSSAYDIVK